MQQPYICQLGLKADKKKLLRFYKNQHYSAGFIGGDHWYYISKNTQIVAAVIVSQVEHPESQYFLHGLVTAKAQQNLGLATALLAYAQSQHSPLVCFAANAMSAFYLAKQFKKVPQKQINTYLNEQLSLRFHRYLTRKADLRVFIYDTPVKYDSNHKLG